MNQTISESNDAVPAGLAHDFEFPFYRCFAFRILAILQEVLAQCELVDIRQSGLDIHKQFVNLRRHRAGRFFLQ